MRLHRPRPVIARPVRSREDHRTVFLLLACLAAVLMIGSVVLDNGHLLAAAGGPIGVALFHGVKWRQTAGAPEVPPDPHGRREAQ